MNPTPRTPLAGNGENGNMDGFALPCPRCRQIFSSANADDLADALVAHVEREHGHAPPREHVLARIERHNPNE